MESAQLRRPFDIASGNREYMVIASLPKNSTSLAVQAEEAGVDAILLNIDGEEGSPQGHFGSYDLHDAYINDTLSTISTPCGVFIGGGRQLTQEYWERVMSSPFGFVEMYAHHMPMFVLSDARVKKIGALTTGYILEQVKQMSQMDAIEALDIATVPPQSRGSPFTLLDYATVKVISGISLKPVLLRTQKRVAQTDIPGLVAAGVRGIVVDPAILSGTEEAYKEELANLSPRQYSDEPRQ